VTIPTIPTIRTKVDRSSLLAELAMAIAGGLLIGAGGRGRRGLAMRVAGAALLGAAARPAIIRTLKRKGGERRRMASRASIEIEKPVAEVFAFFKDFESFPRVVGKLRSVVDYQDGRSHWEAYSPSGGVTSWDVVVTKYVPNSVIAWESVPSSVVEMYGIIRFVSLEAARTRIDIEMVYHPLQTGLSDAVHAVMSRRPAEQLYGALERARFYLESLPQPVEDDMPAPAKA
jgi:uncharacterized membrane protein